MLRKINSDEINNVSGGYEGAIVLHYKGNKNNDEVKLFELTGNYDTDANTISRVGRLAKFTNGHITGFVDKDNSDSMWGYQFDDDIIKNLNKLSGASKQ